MPDGLLALAGECCAWPSASCRIGSSFAVRENLMGVAGLMQKRLGLGEFRTWDVSSSSDCSLSSQSPAPFAKPKPHRNPHTHMWPGLMNPFKQVFKRKA